VAFHLHEVVGAKMTRRRLTALRFGRTSCRTCPGWSSCTCGSTGTARVSGRTPGPPLRPRRRAVAHPAARADQGRLHHKEPGEGAAAGRAYDALERRIAELSEQEELARIRPELDGNEIMRVLGVPPGPLVGRAYEFLLELRLEQGEIGREPVTQELLRWAAAEGIVPPGPEPDGD